MKCKNCGTEIPAGYVYCEKCGTEVQMVPDYNPLDDVLTAQVRGALDDEQPRERIIPKNLKNKNGMISYTVTLPVRTAYEEEPEEAAEEAGSPAIKRERRDAAERPQKRNTPKKQKSKPRRPVERKEEPKEEEHRIGLKERKRQLEEEQRRKEEKERKRKKWARRKARIFSVLFLLICCGAVSAVLYLNSYSGLVYTGNRYLADGQTGKAIDKLTSAVKKDDSRTEAYKALERIYLAQNDMDTPEQLYLAAVKAHPANVELYRACIEFYQNTDQLAKISELLDACENDGVLDDLNMYVSSEPKFSLEDEHYDDVQQLSIKSSGEAIYYTLDGTEATTASLLYAEPIQIPEGVTTVRAISVNQEGVPSVEVTKTYTVEFPIVDAPAVSPSTGYYDLPMQITIQVPEGYTAYYTISSAAGEIETPTSASTKYTGPVAMPEGNNIFCAVLIDSKGRSSEIKKMNYELVLQ